MARNDWIGLRVARLRDVGGLTQQDLADRVGKSREYISLIENGRRPVDKRGLLVALAEALGVSVSQLLAQPAQPLTRDDLVMSGTAGAVRRALDGPGVVPQQPGNLAAKADAVITARASCDYATLATLLPALISEARAVANDDASPDDVRRAGLDALVKACVYGAYAMKTSGYVDLAMRLAERAELAATKLGNPIHVAAATMAICQALMAEGVRDRALSLSAYGADALQPLIGESNEARGWYCGLHKQAALCSASVGAHDAAHAHLQEAAEVAPRAAVSTWHRDDIATDVEIWRITVALENGGDPESTPDLARRIDRTKLRTPQRLARLHMDAGRGRYARGDTDGCVSAFLSAHDAAPGEVRHRGIVRELVGQMVRDAGRRGGNGALADLAVRMGIDPIDPESMM